MESNSRSPKIAGWIVFAVAATVYFFTAERTGSLWDCGEFILGAYKLQVVHPPGAALFLLIGRMFTWVASLFSDNPEAIPFSVNLMSGIATAFLAAFVAWTTSILGRLALVGRDKDLDSAQSIAVAGAGLVAGLSAAFATSIWFSAVEGEVYGMSTFFTALTLWASVKWYALPDKPQSDRWLIFSIFAAGLSIGVHLLSLLTFPTMAMLYYFKKFKKQSVWGMMAAGAVGAVMIGIVQKVIIAGLPTLWAKLDIMMVNGFGLPFHTGLIPLFIIIGGVIYAGLYYAHKKQNALLQQIFIATSLVIIGFSTIGVVVIRANTKPPVNMNDPSDATRLLPYINREQYGERALLKGPDFDAKHYDTETEDRYGRVGDRYEIVDHKVTALYKNSDKQIFPRMSDNTQGRPGLYKQWMGLDPNKGLPSGRPNLVDNIAFTFNYQMGWMYWRYFMWNFVGRQNGEQGFYSWDKSSGNWLSGIKFIDEWRLGNQDELPETMLNHKARNKYYFIPLLFGLLGLFFHFKSRRDDAFALLGMFLITGLGIIIYSNQPPNEPRERDYVLAGSFFTFAIWIGMGVLALFDILRHRIEQKTALAILASLAMLTAPLLMGFQNFDDHTRREHKASRDYASNFLNSVEDNAIIFTYGDNDTYPLWYAQEVEGIRTDVRVVNLSLIAVDWYIELLRRRVGDSPPLKMTIPQEAYRGKKRNAVYYYNPSEQDREYSLKSLLKFIGEDHPLSAGGNVKLESYLPSRRAYIQVDANAVAASGMLGPKDTAIVSRIPINLKDRSAIIKDDLAILDVIASNLWERPVYFAVTCRPEKMFGMQDYMQLEGLALRIVPVKSNSDRNYNMVGNGRVNTDALFDNVMNKFQWGNFDKEELFVDRSYGPSIQSMQLAIRRAAFALLQEGDKDRAIQLLDRYFEAFPHKNFAYNYMTMYILSAYLQADAYDKAKPHLEILANETADYLEYYFSLDDDVLEQSYNAEFRVSYQTMQNLLLEVRRAGDTEFLTELESLFQQFQLEEVEGPGR